MTKTTMNIVTCENHFIPTMTGAVSYTHLDVYKRQANNVGRRVILPSSFNGSPRNMYQNYLDAMSIVQHFGKPSLLITMTCNPSWPEIVSNIGVGESANFRPDIVVRIFKSKLKALIEGLTLKKSSVKLKHSFIQLSFKREDCLMLTFYSL